VHVTRGLLRVWTLNMPARLCSHGRPQAREHLLRMQSSERYSMLVEPSNFRASSSSGRDAVVDLWNRLAAAYAEAGGADKSRVETPPDSVCCSLLMLGDRTLLQWFLMGFGSSTLGPNPWKPQGCLDDVDVLCRLTMHSIPIISTWLGDICDTGKSGTAKQLGLRAAAVRKWLSNASVVQSAPVSLRQLEARLENMALQHCAAVSGDLSILQWASKTFARARERKMEELAAKVEANPHDEAAASQLLFAISPAPTTIRGDTPASLVPDRMIHTIADSAVVDASKDARKWLNDSHSAVERYRIERACSAGVPLLVYALFWFVEGVMLYRMVLREPRAAFDQLHNISWYTCSVLLFAFSWLIPGQQAVGPVPGWVVQGIPAVLWGSGLATFCVIQLLTALQRLGSVLPEYEDWLLSCVGALLFLGYLVPHTQPLSQWSSALSYGHSISWSLLLIYIVNRALAWSGGEPDVTMDGLSSAVQSIFYLTSAFHPCQFPTDDDPDNPLKTLLVWSYTMLWRLLAFLHTAATADWLVGPWATTVSSTLAWVQTTCLGLLLTYTMLWYSMDADKNVAKQAYVKARALLFLGGWVAPLKRPLKDDLRDWRARTIRDRLREQLQSSLASVQAGFGAPNALSRCDCANPRSAQKRTYNAEYVRATRLVEDETALAALGESLDPALAALMLSLTDKLQDYIFGCLNACLTKHDHLMRGDGTVQSGRATSAGGGRVGKGGKGGGDRQPVDPAFFDDVVAMLQFLVDEGARWERRFAEGNCDGPTAADRQELKIGRAWLANVPHKRVQVQADWELKRQQQQAMTRRREEADAKRKAEEAAKAVAAKEEAARLMAQRAVRREQETARAAQRRKEEAQRRAEQLKIEEGAKRKRDEERRKRQAEAAEIKNQQRKAETLALKKKMLAEAESEALRRRKSGDVAESVKLFSKAIRLAADFGDGTVLARLKSAKESAVQAAAAQAKEQAIKAKEEAERKAAEKAKAAAAAKKAAAEQRAKEEARAEEAAKKAALERAQKQEAAKERVVKALRLGRQLLERGVHEATNALRKAEKADSLLQLLDRKEPELQREIAELIAQAQAAEKEGKAAMARRRAEAEQRKREEALAAAERKKAQEVTAEKERAERAAAERVAAEHAAAEKKAMDEAAAYQAHLLAIALKEEEAAKQQREAEAEAQAGSASQDASSNSRAGSPGAETQMPDHSIEQDFNIEMALGRDLLGDLGIDDLGDDEGMAQLELLSPRDEQKPMSGQRAGLGGAGYSGGQANYIDEEQRRENRLNDCLCPITHEIMRDPGTHAIA
jgi:hypothetical protein